MLVSPEDDEVFSIPFVIKEDVKCLLGINLLKTAGLDNLYSRVLKELAAESSGLLMLIFNRSWNTREISED